MTIQEFIRDFKMLLIDNGTLTELYKIYSEDIPDNVKRIAIMCMDECFLEDGGRLLSYYEVCHSDEEYGTNFVQTKMIPLLDMGDNDFIVYDLSSNLWKKYNIVDYVVFEESSDLENIL